MPQGYLALVLHAHLPFVRHPEYDEFLEEDWFYEAITETYIPLVNMMDGLINDGCDFRLTMSITPPLAAMLGDQLLQDRYVRTVDKSIELAHKEINRTKGDHQFHELAWFYLHRLENCRHVFVDKYHRNLLTAFRKFQDAGKLEIITCGATHGYLPLMAEYPAGGARADHDRARSLPGMFRSRPRGIWLPECAYTPGIDKFLQEAEIRWFVVDTHAIMHAEPRPRYGVYAPLFTRSGPAAFARDIESSVQVWSSIEGYPGDAWYRDFYRDIGYDLDFEYIKPYIQSNGLRKFTGLKYHRITGKGGWKEPYRPNVARERAADHAGNFVFNRSKQIEHLHGVLGMDPIVLAPYDAELYGHWWYEGPEFLNYVFRKANYDQNIFKTTTPGEYLAQLPDPATGHAERFVLGRGGLLQGLARRAERVDLSAPARRRRPHDRAREPVPRLLRPDRPRDEAGRARTAAGAIERLGLHHEDRHDGALRGEAHAGPHPALHATLRADQEQHHRHRLPRQLRVAGQYLPEHQLAVLYLTLP